VTIHAENLRNEFLHLEKFGKIDLIVDSAQDLEAILEAILTFFKASINVNH